MSSDTLTPPPSTTSPFRPIPFADPSRRTSSIIQSDFLAPPLPASTYTSASSRKRSHASISQTSPRRRVRQGTPILIDPETQSTSAERDLDPHASGYVCTTTTIAGPSSYATRAETGSKTDKGATSEGGDEGSVLFSEQEQVAQASGSTIVKGNLEDYIPQPDDVGVAATTEMTEPTDTTGEFVEDEGDPGAEAEEEERNEDEGAEGEMDESRDRNDEDDADGQGEMTPEWAGGPARISRSMGIATQGINLDGVMEMQDGSRRERKRKVEHEAEESDDEQLDEDEMDESYHSGDSELYEMDHRPVLERTAIKRDIRKFEEILDNFRDEETKERLYKVVDRLGEGTFSSVYLAHDLFFHFYNNSQWAWTPDQLSFNEIERSRSRVPVALKKILVTSSPARIENELAILESLRGCRNVSKLITAFRDGDQVIIVMPYEQCDDFRHFYRHMDTRAMREYMKCLLRALKDIHQRGIIHRDVKPANFLYNYEKSTGVLCDFGLAERYHAPSKTTCQHGPASLQYLHGKRIKTSDTAMVEQAVYDARKRSKLSESKIGFSSEDKRPAIKTNRAGTRGFRAPEVLLKCPDQNVSIDVWSAGVILLSILTHKFPVFNSNDDTEALLEIAALFGRSAMEKCAVLHNRTILTNVPTVDRTPDSLTPVILRLNPHIYTPPLPSPTPDEAREHIESIDQAIDLCSKMLRVDTTRRITAANALRHSFFEYDHASEDDDNDTEYDRAFLDPVDPREGKCGHLHGFSGNKHLAYFGDDLVEMQFGQGIPLFHDEMCPEHEHWQDRMDQNVLVVSQHFPREEGGTTHVFDVGAPEPEIVSPPMVKSEKTGRVESKVDRERTLVEKDLNVGSGIPHHKRVKL